jgi:hypothetical protein
MSCHLSLSWCSLRFLSRVWTAFDAPKHDKVTMWFGARSSDPMSLSAAVWLRERHWLVLRLVFNVGDLFGRVGKLYSGIGDAVNCGVGHGSTFRKQPKRSHRAQGFFGW